MTMRAYKLFFGGIAALSVLASAACDRNEPQVVGSGESLERIVEEGFEDSVLARVNGRAITQYDLNLWQLAEGKKQLSEKEQAELLDRIVEAELLYQKGVEMGLDKDPAFRRAMALAEAKVRMLRRKEMQRMVRQSVAGAIQVSDEQAREYYAKNESAIRATYHLGSLQFATEKEAKAALARIRKGETFEQVADEIVRSTPGVEPGRELRTLWDLGSVSWRRIPPAIASVVAEMEPGEVSEIIAHEPAGYIVLKLFEKGAQEEADFATMRHEIVARLKNEAARERFDKFRRELKAAARLEEVAAPRQVDAAPARSVH